MLTTVRSATPRVGVWCTPWGSAIGQAATFEDKGCVRLGFQKALEGQKVGSQVVVVMPPSDGYGASEGHELQKESLVFVVDILADTPVQQ
ncbi:FKBP-type peptidyl-prolyl cis-trans isomerase [Microbacterium sp. Mcb102]|uniref:FKBP-type peptidyl-prolyl cis-trans isomerase n=1 Tax=Microbacterium sp. Mcb102 TaxID=2926012 RepID=UPI0021CA76C2|nr:FKBP-type peptidyl-prolyl cis-trans isomerase [Microbacterium sp. Mcb102]